MPGDGGIDVLSGYCTTQPQCLHHHLVVCGLRPAQQAAPFISNIKINMPLFPCDHSSSTAGPKCAQLCNSKASAATCCIAPHLYACANFILVMPQYPKKRTLLTLSHAKLTTLPHQGIRCAGTLWMPRPGLRRQNAPPAQLPTPGSTAGGRARTRMAPCRRQPCLARGSKQAWETGDSSAHAPCKGDTPSLPQQPASWCIRRLDHLRVDSDCRKECENRMTFPLGACLRPQR